MIKTGLRRHTPVFSGLTAIAAGVVLALSANTELQAEEFNLGAWDGSFDSTFSAGAGWRLEDRDLNKIGISNGGSAWSTNNDDGNLNFDNNSTPFSAALKGLHELDLHRKDGSYGLFMRGTWFRDYALTDSDTEFKQLDDAALAHQGEDARLLDTYIWANFQPFNTRLQVRAGEQVFNWGESTLIGHGLSEVNAIDLGKLRVPGSELKEAFIPAKALWASWQVAENIGLEMFAQFEWEPVRIDAPGTYLSTQDFIGDTRINESAVLDTPTADPMIVPSGCNGSFGMVHLLFGQLAENNYSTQACRTADRDPSDHGQYGVKFSWFSEALGDTDFGFYYVNYHNKRPVISARAHNGSRVEGFLEYLEDIEMTGVSFNTSMDWGLSIGGEITQRKDEPLQVDDVELLFATLQPVGIIPSGTSQLGNGYLPGDEISGYKLIDTYQAQFTLTQLFQNVLGSEQLTVLAEFGANFIPDLPNQDELRFEVAGTSRSGNSARAGNGMGADWTGVGCRQVNPVTGAVGQCEGVETNQFATENSWGYRLIGRLEYANALWGWNMTPRIIFQHDVDGYTPAPISNFIEDRMSATVGTAFDYQNRWRVDFSYARFFGNNAQDPLSDRDFFAAFVSYSI